jgi:DNA-binding GntR family transcriptional regulator
MPREVRTLDAQGMTATPTTQLLAEVREIHQVLESIGIRSWAERADDEALDRLWDAFARVQRYVAAEADPDLVRHAKDRFFRALFEGAGRSIVPESLRVVKPHLRALRHASLSAPGRPAAMLEELVAILAAATLRDTDALTAACMAHLDAEFSSGLEALTAR